MSFDQVEGIFLILFALAVFLLYRYRITKREQASVAVQNKSADAAFPQNSDEKTDLPTDLNNDPHSDKTQTFRKASFLVLLLGILSIGASNIISGLVAPGVGRIEPVSLILIPIYFVSAFFIRRESMTAFLVAFIAFTISGVIGLISSFINTGWASQFLGSGIFGGVTFLNIIFLLIIWTTFFNWYKVLRNS